MKVESSLIDRQQLIEQLEHMKGQVIDPNVGVFGPESMFWRVGRHSATFLNAGRAALLQLAHPWVANAIKQHSRTIDDPMSRFRGTFTNVFTMIFGTLDQVIDKSLAVHQIHSDIHGKVEEDSGAFKQGSEYAANEVGAMLWVHATLWEGSIKMYEMVVGELSREEKEKYYQEAKLFAFMFGIPEDMQPPNWDEFIEYNQQMWDSDVLVVRDAAKEIAQFIFRMNWALTPILGQFEIFTSAVMPERLRDEFGLPEMNRKNQRLYENYLKLTQKAYPHLPKHLRYLPPYNEAIRRLNGKHQPGLITGGLNKLMLGQANLVSA
ncbi:MAG: DUF2236 domain-containing protein [Pseudomonadales bacterium]|nr:DUF2236 domain-containing protein [Pseudomonadales bacterium]